MARITTPPVIINQSSGTTSGTVNWGQIGGTLSSQTDLNSALGSLLSTSGGTISGQLMIAGSSTSDFQGLTLNNGDTTAFNLNSLIFQGSSQTALSKISHMIYSGATSADLRFYLTNAGVTSAAITFEHHGRLGIGVTSPSVPLHVLDAQITEHISADLFSDGIRMYKQGNGTSSSGAVKDTSEVGYHSFYGWDGTAYGRGAFALVTAVGDFGTASHGMKYEIWTVPSGGTTAVKRLTIADTGAATFSGSLTASNLSGTNTGDQDLSSYVTLAGTQTLTNKTLTSPVINSPTGFLTGAANITVGTTAPSSPSTGDLWVDST